MHQVVVHPTKGKGKWVVVAVETPKSPTDSSSHTLLEVWDIETTTLIETFSTRAVVSASEAAEEPQEISVDEAEMDPAAAIAALVRARQESGSFDGIAKPAGYIGMETPRLDAPQPPFPDVRAVVAGAEFGGHTVIHRSHMAEPDSKLSRSSGKGFLITGSEDCKLRYWDLGRPERSVILSGVEVESDKPTFKCVWQTCYRRFRMANHCLPALSAHPPGMQPRTSRLGPRRTLRASATVLPNVYRSSITISRTS